MQHKPLLFFALRSKNNFVISPEIIEFNSEEKQSSAKDPVLSEILYQIKPDILDFSTLHILKKTLKNKNFSEIPNTIEAILLKQRPRRGTKQNKQSQDIQKNNQNDSKIGIF